MSKKPEFSELFFSRTKDFLDLFLVRQQQLQLATDLLVQMRNKALEAYNSLITISM